MAEYRSTSPGGKGPKGRANASKRQSVSDFSHLNVCPVVLAHAAFFVCIFLTFLFCFVSYVFFFSRRFKLVAQVIASFRTWGKGKADHGYLCWLSEGMFNGGPFRLAGNGSS